MKKASGCSILLLIISFNCYSQLITEFKNAEAKLLKDYNCEENDKKDNKIVSDSTFRYFSKKFLSRVSNNPGILNQPSTYASLKLSEDNTIADLQATFPLKASSTLTAGFKAVVGANISDLYSGKDGINSDWGIRLGWNKVLSSSIFYDVDKCEELKGFRETLLKNLIDKENYALINSLVQLKKERDDLNKKRLNAKSIEESKQFTGMIDELDRQIELVKILSDNVGKPDSTKIQAYLEKKVTEFEIEKAKINVYSAWLFNVSANYDRKGFTLFFQNIPTATDRFVDTSYSNYGLTVGFGHYRYGKYYSNFSVNLGFQNRSNLELEENKKYNRAYTSRTLIPSPNGSEQFYTKTKNAFDSTAIQFKTFHSIDLNIQYTALFGENKSFGFNVFSLISHSSHYSVDTRVNLGFGPVISLVDQEKKESKINFSLYGSFRNILDDELTTKEKFYISFNVQLPFSFL